MFRMCSLIRSSQQKTPVAEWNSPPVELLYTPIPQDSKLNLLEERECNCTLNSMVS